MSGNLLEWLPALGLLSALQSDRAVRPATSVSTSLASVRCRSRWLLAARPPIRRPVPTTESGRRVQSSALTKKSSYGRGVSRDRARTEDDQDQPQSNWATKRNRARNSPVGDMTKSSHVKRHGTHVIVLTNSPIPLHRSRERQLEWFRAPTKFLPFWNVTAITVPRDLRWYFKISTSHRQSSRYRKSWLIRFF